MVIWTSPGNEAPSPLRLLLVGPRRTGKSSTGNTLLGRGRVFDTSGGGATVTANGVAAGRQVTVTDAQGWGSSEDSVPRSEKIELLRALSLCGPGPHIILLVIPLLDFTESERRSVERRMEVLTPGTWRHTMVLFTFGDYLRRGKGRSVEEHIQSGGPALHWLMEKCRYRYQVVDNKMAATVETRGGREDGGMMRGGEQKQVRELVSRVEDMVEENGGWHFSLHMYHRLEEEWNRREQELRARMEGERARMGGERVVRKVKSLVGESEGRLKMEVEREEESEDKRKVEGQREEESEDRRKVEGQREEGGSLERWMTMEGEREERAREVEMDTQSSIEKDSEEEEWDTGSDSGGEREEERRGRMEGEREESAEAKTGMMALHLPTGGQRLSFSSIRRLS